MLCPSKWKGENMLGRIRYMQWIPSTCTLNVEVLPLKEGKADNVFMVDRNAKSFTEKVENLKPVSARTHSLTRSLTCSLTHLLTLSLY